MSIFSAPDPGAPPRTDKQLVSTARALGFSCRKKRGEYRIAALGGPEADAYYTADRLDAWGTLLEMTKRTPPVMPRHLRFESALRDAHRLVLNHMIAAARGKVADMVAEAEALCNRHSILLLWAQTGQMSDEDRGDLELGLTEMGQAGGS